MFTEEFIATIIDSNVFTDDQIRLISDKLNIFITNYEITIKSTEIITYNNVPYFYKSFLVAKHIEGMCDSSLRTYNLHLSRFFLKANKPVELLTTNDIRLYLYNYKNDNNVDDSTVEHVRTILNSFFNWCVSNEYLQKNPVSNIKRIKCEKKERQPLTKVELELLRDACSNVKERAILEFLYSTGCRVSELCNAKLSDFNSDNRTILLHCKGNKQNTCYLNAKAYVALNKYLETRNDNIDVLFLSNWKKQYTKEGIEHLIKKLKQKANITKQVSPHVIRHTTATIAIEQGMPIEEVSAMLGHTNINTTLIYAKVNKDKLQYDHNLYVI